MHAHSPCLPPPSLDLQLVELADGAFSEQGGYAKEKKELESIVKCTDVVVVSSKQTAAR